MNETPDIFQKVGGRKFLLSLIVTAGIMILAANNPAALTTEVVIGLLGVIATYSGSNSFITNMMSKNKQASSQAEAPQGEPAIGIEAPETTPPELSQNALDERVAQCEAAITQIIDILKQMQAPKK